MTLGADVRWEGSGTPEDPTLCIFPVVPVEWLDGFLHSSRLCATLRQVRRGPTRDYDLRNVWPSYEKGDWNQGASLSLYFYQSHWCDCHRQSEVAATQPDATFPGETGECEDEHTFLVVKVFLPEKPHLVLYSEVLDPLQCMEEYAKSPTL
jgi:hypothetical protein